MGEPNQPKEHSHERSEPCRATPCAEARLQLQAIHAAGASASAGRAALEQLTAASWPLVHARVRARGFGGADAEDLTQGYFARFFERGDLAYAAAWQGCLLDFLSVSVRHFVSNQLDHDRAWKRGGGRRPVSLDARRVQGGAPEPADDATPERLLAQSQAEARLLSAVEQLRREMASRGGAERFSRLEGCLLSTARPGSYRRMARAWGVGESAARVAVHRLRRRLAALLVSSAARPSRPADAAR